jgi:ribosome-associated protein
MADEHTETIEISGGMIRLGQFLKYAQFAESGAHAGALIADGDVTVDGEVETRRGRQLGKGMVVEVRTPQQVLRAKVG